MGLMPASLSWRGPSISENTKLSFLDKTLPSLARVLSIGATALFIIRIKTYSDPGYLACMAEIVLSDVLTHPAQLRFRSYHKWEFLLVGIFCMRRYL